MCPTLFHIYGPFSVNFYGLFIAIGIIIALIFAKRDPRAAQVVTEDQAVALLTGSIIAGVFGARILYFIVEPANMAAWYDLFAFWQGGGTELGSIIAVALFCGIYVRKKQIKILPLLDIAGNYAPLVQGFARIGCFCAGCCYGSATTVPWAILYTHPESIAPLCVRLHPTQLYTALLFFMFFFVIKYTKPYFTAPGQQFCVYLMGASMIRFFTDFLRGDQVFSQTSAGQSSTILSLFTLYQWISLCLFISALISLVITLHRKKT